MTTTHTHTAIAEAFLSELPLPERTNGTPLKAISSTIKHVRRSLEPLVIISTICPSYSTNAQGTPDYQRLEAGISPNTQKHFDYVLPAIRTLHNHDIRTQHAFFMADTEVDLLPFLQKLAISPEEFLATCHKSLEEIREKLATSYESKDAQELPFATTFLEYFGEDAWYKAYHTFFSKLLEAAKEPGRIQTGLQRDYLDRKKLISSLLGPVSKEQGLHHIARQKAQYMAFASLIREHYRNRLIIINHRTPNLAWMNDVLVREHPDPQQQAQGNLLTKIPLVELDISTLPT